MAIRYTSWLLFAVCLFAGCHAGDSASGARAAAVAAATTVTSPVTAAARPPCKCHQTADGLPVANRLPAAQTAAAVEFHRDVEPILRARCVGCHRRGGIAPFALETYAEAATYALAISDAVVNRRMPPFNARGDGSCQSFRETRWLSDTEIATLTGWVAAGYMEGAPLASRPAAPPPIDGLASPDVTLMPPRPYTPQPGTSPDSYRCFPLHLKNSRDRFVSGFQIQPGNPTLVHHAVAWGVDDAAGERILREADGKDGAPGSFCWTPDVPKKRFLGGWLPGTRPIYWPAGTGTRLKAHQTILLEVHYNGGGNGETDQPRVLLETKPGPLNEIRFAAFDTEDRFALPPGQAKVKHAQVFDRPELHEGFELLGIVPHMHTLGQTLRAEFSGAAGDTCLVDVDRWNFHWQQAYLYDKPLRFDAAADRALKLACTFDTTGVADTIYYGMHTKDEMCQVLLAYVKKPVTK